MEASILKKGTKIYTLKNYSKDFRLTTKINDIWIIYESYDYTSIIDKVIKIEVYSCEKFELLKEITDKNTIYKYTEMFAETYKGYPMNNLNSVKYNNDKKCRISFVLEDGSNITDIFYYENGCFFGHDKMPQEFIDEIIKLINKN